MTRLLIILLAAFLATLARAGSVELKLSARVAPGEPVVLEDIAVLDGEDVDSLRDVVVLDAAPASGEHAAISISDVRNALDIAGVNWGFIMLRGSECTLRTGEISATAAAVTDVERRSEPRSVDLGGAETVRTYAARTLAAMFGVDPDALRIAFDVSDQAMLDISDLGRRIEAQPLGDVSGSRIPLSVWVYEGDRVVSSGTIRADVLVRRPAVTLTQGVARGERIPRESLSREIMWLEPSAGTPVTEIGEAVGGVARARMAAGTVLRMEHLEAPVVIRRGELVTVHCVSGGVVVKSKARAMHDARRGDLVELSLGRNRQSFLARADAPGRAVMRIGETGSVATVGGDG